jgi:hypothetical protein
MTRCRALAGEPRHGSDTTDRGDDDSGRRLGQWTDVGDVDSGRRATGDVDRWTDAYDVDDRDRQTVDRQTVDRRG